MAGDSQLLDMIARVRSLGSAPEGVAKVAAPLVQEANRGTALQGKTPDGETWAPRKGGGAPVLSGAAEAIEAVALGPVVQLRLVGTPAGPGKKGPGGDQTAQAIQNHRRAIIPDKSGAIPATIGAALTEAGRRYFNRAMGR